jgi:hypothetical protein
MLTRVRNRTGMTIHTSAYASSPALALADGPVEIPTAAWEHTLACGPGLRSLLGEGDGKIEVTDLSVAEAPAEAPTEEPAEEPVAVVVPKGKRR